MANSVATSVLTAMTSTGNDRGLFLATISILLISVFITQVLWSKGNVR